MDRWIVEIALSGLTLIETIHCDALLGFLVRWETCCSFMGQGVWAVVVLGLRIWEDSLWRLSCWVGFECLV